MRGIVELEILKAIEKELPVNIPVRSFFDLIVGTRFVHSIPLLTPIKPPRRASFRFCGCIIISRHDLMLSIINNLETDTVLVAQGELLHWGLELKDGPSMSVSTILRGFAILLSRRGSSMVFGDWSNCPPLITTTANLRRSHSKQSSKMSSQFRNSPYSVGSRITTILR